MGCLIRIRDFLRFPPWTVFHREGGHTIIRGFEYFPPSFSLVDVSAEYDDSNPRPVLNKMFYNYDVPRTAVETEN